MTNPARARWGLRRAPKERPPQQSDERKWVKFGVHRRAFSSESKFGFEIRQRFAKMAASEAANGKSRMNRSPSVKGKQARMPGDSLPEVRNSGDLVLLVLRCTVNHYRPNPSVNLR